MKKVEVTWKIFGMYLMIILFMYLTQKIEAMAKRAPQLQKQNFPKKN